jgi:hypothetical protein
MVATSNPKHLSQFIIVQNWTEIVPQEATPMARRGGSSGACIRCLSDCLLKWFTPDISSLDSLCCSLMIDTYPMPKKNAAKISPASKKSSPRKTIAIEAKASTRKSHADGHLNTPKEPSQLPPSFENKAGRYELIRVAGDQAYYTFTNRHNKTVDAAMPVLMWRKMQQRAVGTYKESA